MKTGPGRWVLENKIIKSMLLGNGFYIRPDTNLPIHFTVIWYLRLNMKG